MSRFDGKVAIVTGAASGVGRATTMRLSSEGAKVYGLDIDEAGLQAVAEETASDFAFTVCDISSRDACHRAVSAAVAEFGRLDILANVAGIARSHHLTDVTEQEWRQMMGVNLDGTFWMTQAAVPHLQETAGNVVNVASNAGLMGQAYTVPYCATKAAVINMTKAMAMEYVKTDIRINAVAPGGMVTGLTMNYSMPDDVDFELMQPYTGFRGMAEPETAANAICWLASDEAARCNGTILSIDGGLTAG
jgi:meso-butanediol dehydrogenase/(S,S)-butanediol dehydrogenase/diacetyl reductase